MTAAKFCGVFDEIFLVNFCLPITSFNVVDMTNVDKILDSTSYADSLILKEEDLTSEMLDNRPGDLSENPETARQDGMDDEDLLQICSQRRWSTFCLNTKINSADLGVPKLNELSPIMKELDDTFFGNDRLCDLFTTFDTINSPLWLEVGNRRNDDTKIDSKVEDLVMNIDQMNSPVLERNRGIRICGESDNCKPLPLPTYDHDFPELNQFDQLSISDCPARKSNHVIKDEKSQKLKKTLRKMSRMKQTTVTFFYDSDDEIKENSEDYESLNNQNQPTKYGLRTALGLVRKNKNIAQHSSYIENTITTGSTQGLRSDQRSHLSNHYSEVDRRMSPVRRRLQTWIRNVSCIIPMCILYAYIRVHKYLHIYTYNTVVRFTQDN